MSVDAVTRRNHYVPIWYQKGFIHGQGRSLHYLDLKPERVILPDGRSFVGRCIGRRAPRSCFWAWDLYTAAFGGAVTDDVERFLFGSIDNDGASAVRAFAAGDRPTAHAFFLHFFEHLDAQKLRTPKGLDWIKSKYPTLTQQDLMVEMQHLRRMHCTMWVEGVREIVSAEASSIKFIISDHPVTVFNAACPPESGDCRYPNDPSIALNGSQTLFALDANHCMIISNLDYAKSPSEVELTGLRKNARHYGQTIARTDALIRTRRLGEEEVAAINFVLKSRASRYIAASDESHLYPERTITPSWEAAAHVLRPPRDRLWNFGGEIHVGYKDGSSHYQDAYGRTSHSHNYLRKESPKTSPGPNDLCACGSGRKFKKCCEGVPAADRPRWDVYSIRERNLVLGNAITGILGLDRGKSWIDVRRELSDEQVKDIHQVFQGLWTTDTNIADLLPRLSESVFRAMYMGMVDPRTIAASVTSWLACFDEVIVVSGGSACSDRFPLELSGSCRAG